MDNSETAGRGLIVATCDLAGWWWPRAWFWNEADAWAWCHQLANHKSAIFNFANAYYERIREFERD